MMLDDSILLEDLLHLDDFKSYRIKIKFNISNGYDDPLELWLQNRDSLNKEWLFWHDKQHYFQVGDIAICLVKVGYDLWLLTTIQRVTKDLGISGGISYEGEELQQFSKFFGRIIIHFHNTSRSMGRMYDSIKDQLVVNELLPSDFEDDAFPGYDQVCIDFPKLQRILDLSQGKADWIGALEHQKAVYLITDKSNGKLYVGSATGDNGMLLQRWRNYAADGHGGNVELRQLVEDKGIDYIRDNFQYSILENYNARVGDDYILQRESWWKNILKTREFGYNSN